MILYVLKRWSYSLAVPTANAISWSWLSFTSCRRVISSRVLGGVPAWSWPVAGKPKENSGRDAGVESGGRVFGIAPWVDAFLSFFVFSFLFLPLESAINNGMSPVADADGCSKRSQSKSELKWRRLPRVTRGLLRHDRLTADGDEVWKNGKRQNS